MGINIEEEIDIHGAVCEISNEAFACEYEAHERLNDDYYYHKDTRFLYKAEFLGDRVRLIYIGNADGVNAILSSQSVKEFRNKLIDILGADEKLKW